MPHISSTTLAPMRSSIRIGASLFRVKGLIDLTVVSWLEIQRDIQQYNKACQTNDALAAQGHLFGLTEQVLYDQCPEGATWEEAIDTLRAFLEGLQESSKADSPERKEEPDYGLCAARLAQVYGGGMWHWLNEAPLPVFNAGLACLTGLRAEHNLEGVTIGVLAVGHVEKYKAMQITNSWERQAQDLKQVDPEPETMESFIAKLGRVGFKTEVV